MRLESTTITVENMQQIGQHSAGARAESLHLDPRARANRVAQALEISKSSSGDIPPTTRPFLPQQDHTS